jgi:hypothetical protein
MHHGDMNDDVWLSELKSVTYDAPRERAKLMRAVYPDLKMLICSMQLDY